MHKTDEERRLINTRQKKKKKNRDGRIIDKPINEVIQ